MPSSITVATSLLETLKCSSRGQPNIGLNWDSSVGGRGREGEREGGEGEARRSGGERGREQNGKKEGLRGGGRERERL